MSTLVALELAALTVVVNGILGHYAAPLGMELTPVVLSVTTALVCFGTTKVPAFWLSLLTYAFVAFNDVLIKKYSGGTHDVEGAGWIHLFLAIGLVPTFGQLTAAVVRRTGERPASKAAAVVLFIGLVAAHLWAFTWLRLER